MKQILIYILALVAVFGILLGSAFLVKQFYQAQDKISWNNGKCPYCEKGKWELKGHSSRRYSYVYVCDNCQAVIEVMFRQEG